VRSVSWWIAIGRHIVQCEPGFSSRTRILGQHQGLAASPALHDTLKWETRRSDPENEPKGSCHDPFDVSGSVS